MWPDRDQRVGRGEAARVVSPAAVGCCPGSTAIPVGTGCSGRRDTDDHPGQGLERRPRIAFAMRRSAPDPGWGVADARTKSVGREPRERGVGPNQVGSRADESWIRLRDAVARRAWRRDGRGARRLDVARPDPQAAAREVDPSDGALRRTRPVRLERAPDLARGDLHGRQHPPGRRPRLHGPGERRQRGDIDRGAAARGGTVATGCPFTTSVTTSVVPFATPSAGFPGEVAAEPVADAHAITLKTSGVRASPSIHR